MRAPAFHRRGTTRRLNVREQAAWFRAEWPRFRVRVEGGLFVAEGAIQPRTLSPTYRVRIDFRWGGRPEVTVLSPRLERRADGAAIPHVYAGNHPCLYDPDAGDWHSSMKLGDLVGWLTVWLAYYETWHITGHWDGGGRHPAKKDDVADPASDGHAPSRNDVRAVSQSTDDSCYDECDNPPARRIDASAAA